MRSSAVLRTLSRCALVILFVTALCVAVVSWFSIYRAPRLYKARVTLTPAIAVAREKPDNKEVARQLAQFEHVVTSSTVINRTANSLATLGLAVDIASLLENTTVRPIRRTNILMVEVVSNDPNEARDVANELVNQGIRFYGEMQAGRGEERRRAAEARSAEARAALDRAIRAREAAGPTADLAKLDLDVKAAEQAYLTSRTRLDEATLEVAEARRTSDITVIDQARAVPESPRMAWKTTLWASAAVNSLLLATWIGFLIGKRRASSSH